MSENFTEIEAAVARRKNEPFSIERLSIRAPGPGEVLVKMVAVGLCHTDIIMRDQVYPVPQPIVLGHEGSGVVSVVGPNVTNFEIGDHVLLSFASCGLCDTCLAGEPAYCVNYFQYNFSGCDCKGGHAIRSASGETIHDNFFGQSSFATYAVVNVRNIVKVSKDAPLKLLGPLGCGIQTGAGAVINSLKVAAGSSFTCFGAGSVGLSGVLAAIAVGATTIIAVDVVESRLDLARELGATHVVNPKDGNLVERIKEITSGKGTNYAIETTGIPGVFSQAVAALSARGSIGIIGASPLGTKVEIDPNDVLITGKTIMGICEGDSVPANFIPRLIDLYSQGKFPFDKLVKYYSFAQINQAVDESMSGAVLKPILVF
ncbi:NAD(P)-dependent alcohol dehydrogenase [Burkholderia cenocepacia]|uniref:NAD(P)-dependent alcohol dehydrogenase n=1 Tax=Burkholderia cenocepacia TaxID=95486 RepID=UPI00286EEDAC|nr:NAD(P)-dependent alcohol dehydrogenase [Burkholderia cenocepacia]